MKSHGVSADEEPGAKGGIRKRPPGIAGPRNPRSALSMEVLGKFGKLNSVVKIR